MRGMDRATNRQLLRATWPFLVVVVLMVALASVSLQIMSSVRAYIGGESTWSKGQKDAVFYLSMYGHTGDGPTFDKYQAAIARPLALQRARLALDRDTPDVAAARQALIFSGIFPGDVDGVIWVFRTFRHLDDFKTALGYWSEGDTLINSMASVGDRLQAELKSPRPGPDDIDRLMAELERINETVSPISVAFSNVLSSAFRKVATLLLVTNVAVALILAALSGIYARRYLAAVLSKEKALRASEARARAMLGSIGEAVISLRPSGVVEFLNPVAERLLDTTPGAALGQSFATLASFRDEHDGTLVDLIREAFASDESPSGPVELQLNTHRGATTYVQVVTSVLRDFNDAPSGVVLLLRNMTEHREYVENLAWQATHDKLTGLLNREAFEHRLGEVVNARAADEKNGLTTLIVLDLDQFKTVNDSFGHAAGDVMLQQIAQFIAAGLEPGELAGRLGGDEFGLLLATREYETAHERAETIRRSFAAFEWTWGTHHLTATASIGAVDLRVNALSDAKLALRYADVACYMAKARGRDRVQIASSTDGELTRQVGQVSWAGRIRDALAQNRFRLYVQPICRTSDDFDPDRRVEHHHHEILLRMVDEDGSIIAPGAFIPAAERYGLMSAIDRWVVKESLRRIRSLPNDPRVEFAINLSGASIGDERFIDYLFAQITQSGVRPQSLCFEITETTAVANLGIAGQFISELKDRGCRFALDDFGAGMSSFGYLKGLPVDYLKIDGSFIKDMLSDPVDQEMVAAINDIAHSMGRKTIAEYVEDRDTLMALRKMGVDYVQGYYFGRPQPWVCETSAETLS
ncbi:diguanylate cyclase [Pararobbsia alpina]|uniref:putative bifunctional diguanylate cyclase/phosphodiesterase n=1 Tax=Pararobbsia alpina TaxID=621374 RepID=UPI0039A725EE